MAWLNYFAIEIPHGVADNLSKDNADFLRKHGFDVNNDINLRFSFSSRMEAVEAVRGSAAAKNFFDTVSNIVNEDRPRVKFAPNSHNSQPSTFGDDPSLHSELNKAQRTGWVD